MTFGSDGTLKIDWTHLCWYWKKTCTYLVSKHEKRWRSAETQPQMSLFPSQIKLIQADSSWTSRHSCPFHVLILQEVVVEVLVARLSPLTAMPWNAQWECARSQRTLPCFNSLHLLQSCPWAMAFCSRANMGQHEARHTSISSCVYNIYYV